jgi:hypothetical protein
MDANNRPGDAEPGPGSSADKPAAAAPSGWRKLARWQSLKPGARWVAGIAGAAVLAFVGAYFTVLGNHAGTAATRPGPPGGEPVQVDLVTVPPSPDQSHVIPPPAVLPAGQVTSLNAINATTPQFWQWFDRRGAVAADNLLIQVVVSGNRDSQVRIVSLQPVVSCRAPLAGTLFFSPAAGADTATQLILNLDQPLAPSRYLVNVNGHESGGTDFFSHFTVSLRDHEQYTFLVNASTSRQYCRFTLNMSVLDGTHVVSEPITDNGHQFQVTSIVNENSLSPGAFAGYKELFVGGVAATGLPGSGTNQFGDPLWLRADPATYKQ